VYTKLLDLILACVRLEYAFEASLTIFSRFLLPPNAAMSMANVNADVGAWDIRENWRQIGVGEVVCLPVHISLGVVPPPSGTPLSSHMLNGNFAFNFKCYL